MGSLNDFINEQEPLGKEFEQVLQDNLWELMIHTNKETELGDEEKV